MLSNASAKHRWISGNRGRVPAGAGGGLAPLTVILLLLVLPGLCFATTTRRERAQADFDKAQELRSALEGLPEASRREADYQTAVRLYERALHYGPSTALADDSLAAAAGLLSEMARVYRKPGYAVAAAEKYRFLMRAYPASRFVKEARRQLAVLEAEAAPPEPEPEPKTESKAEVVTVAHTATVTQGSSPRLVLITSIRHWATPSYTRIVVEMDGPVEYQAGRISNPERIFFDLHGTRLNASLRNQTLAGDDGLLKRIRMAHNQIGITRVVLEVGNVRDYSAFMLPNPYRLIVDINGTGRPEPPTIAKGKTQPARPDAQAERAELAALPNRAPGSGPTFERVERSEPAPPRSTAGKQAAKRSETRKVEPEELPGELPAPRGRVAGERATSAALKPEEAILEPIAETAAHRPAPGPVAEVKGSREKRAADPGEKSATAAKTRVPQPTSNGGYSYIRALGLKIGRIVIDAGHGGHDTGTIGPTGLTEKEVVLDISKRLGALVEERLGGEVVYTRSDDTFVPLETRTAIANQKQADLFVSVHANSSRTRNARGVETYYLNFASDPEALEVAARENAVSDKSIHELQDLVKKITLSDKREESREFAVEVQKSLYAGMSRGNRGLRDRGVKKAPFVVLIGANMPSILAEISFVSNPTDERLLKRGEYRQRIAEALFRGVQRYVNSLAGIKIAEHRQ